MGLLDVGVSALTTAVGEGLEATEMINLMMKVTVIGAITVTR